MTRNGNERNCEGMAGKERHVMALERLVARERQGERTEGYVAYIQQTFNETSLKPRNF